MKLFVYDWNFITKTQIYSTFSRMNIQFDLFSSQHSPRKDSQAKAFINDLKKAFNKKGYDAIFSVNYFQQLADYAHEMGCLYICWTYDSPSASPQAKEQLSLDTNRLFIFDSCEYDMIKESGVDNVYYMPLAADIKGFGNINPTMQQRKMYSAEVAFVGQLYQSDMDKIFPLFDEYSAGYVSALINTQLKVYGKNIIPSLLNNSVMEQILNEDVSQELVTLIDNSVTGEISSVDLSGLTVFLLKAVTNKERLLLLQLLGKYFHVKHYSHDSVELPGVDKMDSVNYDTVMPVVFKCSKINLNITLKTLRRAIPQRVFDILACGGLCLTNYQEDLFKHFEDNKHLLVYSSIEEALDKCKYYLANESEAERIRYRGHKLVKDNFSYNHQIKEIFRLSGL